jgi:hypothetical protein
MIPFKSHSYDILSDHHQARIKRPSFWLTRQPTLCQRSLAEWCDRRSGQASNSQALVECILPSRLRPGTARNSRSGACRLDSCSRTSHARFAEFLDYVGLAASHHLLRRVFRRRSSTPRFPIQRTTATVPADVVMECLIFAVHRPPFERCCGRRHPRIRMGQLGRTPVTPQHHSLTSKMSTRPADVGVWRLLNGRTQRQQVRASELSLPLRPR